MSSSSKVTDSLSALSLDTNIKSPTSAQIVASLLKSPTAASLKDANHKFHIVQVGAGVVGGAYVDAYCSHGDKVSVIEMNPNILKHFTEKGINSFHAKDDEKKISLIENVDFIMISINTPQLKDADNKPIAGLNMSYLMSSIPNIANIVKRSPAAMIMLRSTIPPMISQQYKTEVEKLTGFPIQLAFQPEFLRAKSALEDALNPWHVVLGVHKDAPSETQNKLMKLYTKFVTPRKISFLNVEEAELLKMMHNDFNAYKISYFNQCYLIGNAMKEKYGIDVDINKISAVMVKTCEGLLNAKYGTKAGHGFYGTCLPKDISAFEKLEEDLGLEASLFKQTRIVNDIIKRTDKEEILDGDHHMSFKSFVKTDSSEATSSSSIKPKNIEAIEYAIDIVATKASETPKHDAAHKLHDEITSQ